MDFLTTIRLGSRESSIGGIDMRVNNKGFIQTLVFLLSIGLSFSVNADSQKIVQVIAIEIQVLILRILRGFLHIKKN